MKTKTIKEWSHTFVPCWQSPDCLLSPLSKEIKLKNKLLNYYMTCLSFPVTPESIPHWDIKLSTGVMFFFSQGPHRTNGRYTLLIAFN